MLEIFRNNYFFNSLLLLPYLIVVRMGALWNSASYTLVEGDTVYAEAINSLVSSPVLQEIYVVIFLYIQAVYINRIVIRNRLAADITLFPGLVYILLMNSLFWQSGLVPGILANFFVLVGFSALMQTYKKPEPATQLFNAGFFFGVATLLVPEYIYLLLLGILTLFIIRTMKLQELLQYLFGYLTFVAIVSAVNFLVDIPVFAHLVGLLPSINLWLIPDTLPQQLWLLAFVLLLLISFLGYGRNTSKKSIQSQRKIDVLYWFMFIGLISVIFAGHLSWSAAYATLIPVSILISMPLSRGQNKTLLELAHVAVFFAVAYLLWVF